jgi:hypothetical protein
VTLQQWANVGDIVASIAVIASLIYLGVQLRNGNREARARTVQSAMDSELSVTATLAQHSSTWEKVATGKDLRDDEEVRLGVLLFNLLMTEGESRFQQYGSGFLDAATWESRRNSLAGLVRLPIFGPWRQSFGALNHTAGFLALIDDLAARGEPG